MEDRIVKQLAGQYKLSLDNDGTIAADKGKALLLRQMRLVILA